MEASLFYNQKDTTSVVAKEFTGKKPDPDNDQQFLSVEILDPSYDEYGIVSGFDLKIGGIAKGRYSLILSSRKGIDDKENPFNLPFSGYVNLEDFKINEELGNREVARFDTNWLSDAVKDDPMTGRFRDYTGLCLHDVSWYYEPTRGAIPPWVNEIKPGLYAIPVPPEKLTTQASTFFQEVYPGEEMDLYAGINLILDVVPNYTACQVSVKFDSSLLYRKELFDFYRLNFEAHIAQHPTIGLLLGEIIGYLESVENNVIPRFQELGIMDASENFYWDSEKIRIMSMDELLNYRFNLFFNYRDLDDFAEKFKTETAPDLTQDQLLAVCARVPEDLFAYMYPSKAIQVIDAFLNKYSSLRGTNLYRNDFREEEAIIKILNGIGKNVATDAHVYCKDILDALEEPPVSYITTDDNLAQEKATRFKILYTEYKDFVGSENLKHFSVALFRIWNRSSYNPNSKYMRGLTDEVFDTAFNYQKFGIQLNPEQITTANELAPYTIPVIEMKANDSLGFYFDDMTFKFHSEMEIQCYKEEVIETPYYGEYGGGTKTIENKYQRPYHIWCPVVLKGIDPNQELAFYIPHQHETINNIEESNPAPIPIFFLKAIDDYGDIQDAWTAIEYTVDAISTVLPFTWLVKLRYLSKVSLIKKIIGLTRFSSRANVVLFKIVVGVKSAEMTGGALNIILKLAYSNNGCTNTTWCPALKLLAQSLELSALGVDLVYGSVKLYKNINDFLTPAKASGSDFPAINNDPNNPSHPDLVFEGTLNGSPLDEVISGAQTITELENYLDFYNKSNFQAFLTSVLDFSGLGHNFGTLANKLNSTTLSDYDIGLIASFVMKKTMTDDIKDILKGVEREILDGNDEALEALHFMVLKELTPSGDVNGDFIARLARNFKLYKYSDPDINLKKLLLESEIAWIHYKQIAKPSQDMKKFFESVEDMTDAMREHFDVLIKKYRYAGFPTNTLALSRARGTFFEDYVIDMYKKLPLTGQGLTVYKEPFYLKFKSEIQRLYPEAGDLDDWDMLSRPMLGLSNVTTSSGKMGHIKPDICFVKYNAKNEPVAFLIWDIKLNPTTAASANQKLAQNSLTLTLLSTNFSGSAKGYQRIRPPRNSPPNRINSIDQNLIKAGNNKLALPNNYDLFGLSDGDQNTWDVIDLDAGIAGLGATKPIIKGNRNITKKKAIQ